MRIVAGDWRGRALRAPSGIATRPTADRVRQALFDILIHARWAGPDVLEDAREVKIYPPVSALAPAS